MSLICQNIFVSFNAYEVHTMFLWILSLVHDCICYCYFSSTDVLRSLYVDPAVTNYGGNQCFTFVTDYNEESELLTEGSRQIASK